ncbi:protein-L-isoaspartate O-methyltransferase [Palleronia sediminis]|uniref:Protein-L-isoaspartate O-methyltransferase n=1 Tax=Palleronia sediminis TaxID=2547833 RepID=A0A4R6ARE3_9RHOB|nr:protein-L-isoaspartate O-methyltransferase [Palleronia sediminis]TDL84313.1 protein-L-isoaspartate O-methyltransferase [Palleronia sediminis]
MSDFAEARRVMVDTQVRPSDITLFPIIEAMLSIPREEFVPSAMRSTAYLGEHIPIGPDRVILDPRTLAKLLETADIQPTHLVLDLGAGHGYSTAVIAHLAEAVVAVEPDEALAREAESALAEAGIDNAAVECAELVDGAPAHAPYDVIVVQGGVQVVPDAIIAQLREGGRIVCLFIEGHLGTCRLGIKVDGRMNWRYAFNGDAPVLPGFAKVPEFSL